MCSLLVLLPNKVICMIWLSCWHVYNLDQSSRWNLCVTCVVALRCCSRQHSVWARAAGSPHPDTGTHPATPASLWTGNTGAGKSVPVSHTSAVKPCYYPSTHKKERKEKKKDLIFSSLFPHFSRSSVDYVAPTPDNFTQNPLIVPSSPTGPENEHGNN